MRAIAHTLSALALVFISSALSALAIPTGDSFCPVSNSTGVDFAGFVFTIFAFIAAFIIGSIFAVWLLRRPSSRQQSSYRAFVRLAALLLVPPLFSLALSIAYGYQTCPGYGHSLTPEQKDHLKYGFTQNQNAA
jgi:hypothetical protein